MFDIIVPIFNSFHQTRRCIESVIRYASKPYMLYLIDDGSDSITKEKLQQIQVESKLENIILITNAKNCGYLQSVNRGIQAGHSEYVLTLNSDALVLPGYMEKVHQSFISDTKIGAVTGLSNWANWTRVPFIKGTDVFKLNDFLTKNISEVAIDINNASGFFFAVRRCFYETLGLFDPIFDPGYYEETDFCMRLLDSGLRVVVNPSLFVYHFGHGSFELHHRNKNMEKNEVIFMQKWGEKYTELENEWKSNDPLSYVKNRLTDFEKSCLNSSFPTKSPESSSKPKIKPKPSIVFVLPGIDHYGGVISVFQLVNELILLGFDANIVTYGKVSESIYDIGPIYFRPSVYPDEYSMIKNHPRADIYVATHWSTVEKVLQFLAVNRYSKAAYFVQDFEPHFYEPQDVQYKKAEMSYFFIKSKIVKTNWLMDKMKQYGNEVELIPIGLNLDIFYDKQQEKEKLIISHARPAAKYRNYQMVLSVFRTLSKILPDYKFGLIGNGVESKHIDFPCNVYGKVSSLVEVAKILAKSSCLIDISLFQGFGRPGLEAMACGVPSVLTCEGGITEYAKHMHNCLLVNPTDHTSIVDSVIKLMTEPYLREKIRVNGVKSVTKFCHRREGAKFAEYMLKIWDPSAQNSCTISSNFKELNNREKEDIKNIV